MLHRAVHVATLPDEAPPVAVRRDDPARSQRPARVESALRPWIVFAGGVLIVVVLDWARPVLIPIGLAVLFTFLLNPPVTALQRWFGRLPSVVIVVTCSLITVLLLGWALGGQISGLADALPQYRRNIRQKAADIRHMSDNRSLARVQSAMDDIRREWTFGQPASPSARTPPATVAVEPSTGFWGLPLWATSLVSFTGSAALVTVLVSFMLIEYRDLRDRVIAVIGRGYVANTTRAFDEAASRVSRYLLMQSLINLTYGILVASGLWVIGVPYPLLWGALGAVFRFVPYVGTWMAAGAPVLVSLAAFSDWRHPLWTGAWFVALELFTNLVLETVLYAGAAGVSQVALLVAVAFWTWVWGPVGLLMATPLTVCVVVIGKHVPGLWFLSMLLTDRPALSPDATYYQRLLAGDHGEALDLVEEHARTHAPEETYDALLLPALNFAERDRRAGRISVDEERSVALVTRDLLATIDGRSRARGLDPADVSRPGSLPPVRVLACASDALADEVALDLLEVALAPMPIRLEKAPGRMLASEVLEALSASGSTIVCLIDLPPKSPSRARYLVKRLRQARPDLTILVARWAPPGFAHESADALLQAGANEVASTLLETRDGIRRLCETEAT
jgi:predicted PurR-regulated permease PerM